MARPRRALLVGDGACLGQGQQQFGGAPFMTGYASGANVGGLIDQGMQVVTRPFQTSTLATRVQGIPDSAPLPVSGSI